MDLLPWIAPVAAVITAIGALYAAYNTRKGRQLAQSVDAKIVKVGADVYEIGKRVDGRLSELLEAEKGQARAEGVAAGEQSQRDRSSGPQA